MCDNSRECAKAAASGFGTPPERTRGDSSGRWLIRPVHAGEFDMLLEIINEAARIYHGVIPADRWHEPYMSPEYLHAEIDAGVCFWGYEKDGELLGVMGVQDVQDVTLIRHAYVRVSAQRCGAGGRLLRRLVAGTDRPVLVGTWAAADWAISFYQKHGFEVTSRSETERLLGTYWDIPARQVETSVVLVQS